MNIIHHELFTEEFLLGQLKLVRLRGFGQPLVYEHARLKVISGVHPKNLRPPQRYVLRPNVGAILDVADSFEKLGVDVFSMRGGLRFWTEGSDPEKDPAIPLLPPIIEGSVEPSGTRIPLINDGMHRVYAAKSRGRTLTIVLAVDVPQEYPYYAYAISEGWAGVEEIDELTEGYKKKEYRDPDNYKALFRDFNKVFPGVQEQRKQTQPELKE